MFLRHFYFATVYPFQYATGFPLSLYYYYIIAPFYRFYRFYKYKLNPHPTKQPYISSSSDVTLSYNGHVCRVRYMNVWKNGFYKEVDYKIIKATAIYYGSVEVCKFWVKHCQCIVRSMYLIDPQVGWNLILTPSKFALRTYISCSCTLYLSFTRFINVFSKPNICCHLKMLLTLLRYNKKGRKRNPRF